MSRVRATGSASVTAAILTILLPMTCQSARAQEMKASQRPIPDDVWKEMRGKSWHPNKGCPAREKLVLLTLPYLDFEGQPRLGEMIVARKYGDQVAAIFTDIFESKAFRIQRMERVDKYGGSDAKSMAANNTSAFNCRTVAGTTKPSKHAEGAAIDINPIQNPWVSADGTRADPPEGMPYAKPEDRTANVVGIIIAEDVVTKAFRDRKWGWGGDWKTKKKDYQHFSDDGT